MEKPMVVFMGITRDKSTYSNLIVVRGPHLVSDSGRSGHIAWGQMEGCRFWSVINHLTKIQSPLQTICRLDLTNPKNTDQSKLWRNWRRSCRARHEPRAEQEQHVCDQDTNQKQRYASGAGSLWWRHDCPNQNQSVWARRHYTHRFILQRRAPFWGPIHPCDTGSNPSVGGSKDS